MGETQHLIKATLMEAANLAVVQGLAQENQGNRRSDQPPYLHMGARALGVRFWFF